MPGIPRGTGRCEMGFMAAILGAAGSAASSSSSAVASEAMKTSESAIESAAANALENGGFASRAAESAAAELTDDTADIMNAGQEAAKAEAEKVAGGKSFFSRAWDESKQSVGIGEGGADMGKVGYNAAKMAVSKGDSSEPQRMDPAPARAAAPEAPAANAEDELNKLRNRMNVS